MEPKKSIRSAAGALLDDACEVVGFGSGKLALFVRVVDGFTSLGGLLEVPLIFLPILFASFSAMKRRLICSNSGSLTCSSRFLIKLVGACFILGTSTRVACSKCRATERKFIACSVCLTNRL